MCMFSCRDYQQIWRVSSGLEAGLIGVNDVAISTPEIPFGGTVHVQKAWAGGRGERLDKLNFKT
jgi:acyl-CoA reductase-like NAD-dependent aldehyde dehydrogenase